MSNVLGFAAGFGKGYLEQTQREKENARIDEDRAMRKTEFDDRQAQVKQERALNVSLADASRPAMVEQGGGGMLAPTTMDNRDVGLPENAALPNQGLSQAAFRVGGKEYATQAQAGAAEKVYNGMDATAGRVGDAYMKAGRVGEAMQFKAGAQRAKADEVEAASRQWRGELGGAMIGGWPGIKKFINENQGAALGGYQVEPVESADKTQVVFNRVDKDGKLTPMPEYTFANNKDGVTQAGFFLDKTVTPAERYKIEAVQSNKAADRQSLLDYRTGTLDMREREIDLKGELGQARLAALQARGDGSSKEERLRYTSLFNESGRRMGEAEKSLATLRRDPMYSMAKPGTAQHDELQGIRASIKQLGEERSVYQSLLAGSQSGSQSPANRESLSDSKPTGPGNPTEADMKRNVSGGMGADPAVIAREIKLTEQQAEGAKDPESKRQLTEYVANLKLQQSRLPGLGNATPAQATQPLEDRRPPLESFGQPSALQRVAPQQTAAAPVISLANAAIRAPVAPPPTEKRYIRTPTGPRRGGGGDGYTYTESPRGLTMAEFGLQKIAPVTAVRTFSAMRGGN